jgi:putative aminopeptidase FrvX
MKLNEKYITDCLLDLLSTPSPTGYTKTIMQKVEDEAVKLGYAVTRNNKGMIIIDVPGKDNSRTIGVSGHVDTLGGIVRAVKDNGRIRMSRIGGFMMNAVENEYCQIHTRSGKVYTGTILPIKPSVHVWPQSDASGMERSEENMEIRLDEVVRTRDDVEALGIHSGAYVSFDARPVLTESGYVKSRHLDDKASVAAMFGLLEHMKREGWQPQYHLLFTITNYEEVGHGAGWIPSEIDEMLAVDMGCIGDDLSCTELDVSICAKDGSGPYDYDMTSRLIELADELGIDYAVDVYPNYSSDASAALRGGNNIRAALIGPGVHASHAMERTHSHAIFNTAKLIAAYVQ